MNGSQLKNASSSTDIVVKLVLVNSYTVEVQKPDLSRFGMLKKSGFETNKTNGQMNKWTNFLSARQMVKV